jgi:solute carrier family 25 (adenine nucleotide translocator) protein 4/5/6/31
MGKSKVKLTFVEDFGLSGAAAVTSKTIAAPIERIKLIVQNQEEMIKKGTLEKPFKGIGDCFAWLMKNEGPLAFWRGNLANCIRYFPTQALNFAFKGRIKAQFKVSKDDSAVTRLGKNVASGGLAGAMSLCFVYSLDYTRTRLANDLKSNKGGGERQYSGLLDCMSKTFKAEGMQGLYRGFVISCVGIVIYRGFYFGLYDTIMPYLPEDVSFAVRFGVGYAVTVSAGLMSYPIDTIRRRMMMTSGEGVKYNGSMDCASQILKAEGFMSFMKGAGANVLRGMAGAGVLAGFDVMKASYIAYAYPESLEK